MCAFLCNQTFIYIKKIFLVQNIYIFIVAITIIPRSYACKVVLYYLDRAEKHRHCIMHKILL